MSGPSESTTAPPVRRSLGERGAVALATAAVVGALLAVDVPRSLGVVAVALALAVRRTTLLVAGTGLLVAGLAHAAHAGLDGVVPGRVDADVVLVSDPEPFGPAVRADVVHDGQRLEAVGRGLAAHRLRGLSAGDLAHVVGTVAPPAPRDRAWFLPRHVAGRLQVDEVERRRGPTGPLAVANGVRALLDDGAASLSSADRALFLGLAIGDDREQDDGDRAAFRAAGLTHLLAVSGQNVAFLLAVAGPVLRRAPRPIRYLLVAVLLGLFTLVTRWEPSVLRAVAMATLSMAAVVLGRPVSRLRLLALAVTVMLVVDPLLVHSVGFRLSVTATLGIVLLAEPVAARLPGPTALREGLAVTTAAQIGVAPVLLTTFDDGMPLAAVPANLLAGPVAGLVMAWGTTAGLLAGALGGGLGGGPAMLLHLPTRLAIAWLRLVAETSAGLPLPVLGG